MNLMGRITEFGSCGLPKGPKNNNRAQNKSRTVAGHVDQRNNFLRCHVSFLIDQNDSDSVRSKLSITWLTLC